jgi:hypothetical protein
MLLQIRPTFCHIPTVNILDVHLHQRVETSLLELFGDFLQEIKFILTIKIQDSFNYNTKFTKLILERMHLEHESGIEILLLM